MKVIKPVTIDDTNMTSEVLEENPDNYVGGTTYDEGDYVLYTDDKIYKSLQGSNTGKTPGTDTDWWAEVSDILPLPYNAGTTYGEGDRVSDLDNYLIYESLQAANTGNALTDTDWWMEVGATNRWKMFDSFVNTQTEFYDEIDVTVSSVQVADSLVLMDVEAFEVEVTVTDPVEGVVFNETYTMADYLVDDYYEYFFEPILQLRDLTVLDLFSELDLPPYDEADIRVQIKEPGGIAKCGHMVVGYQFGIGTTRWGPRLQSISYSRKLVDDFGRYYLSPGQTAKRIFYDLYIDNSRVDWLFRRLQELDALLCVWVGDDTDEQQFRSLTVFGFYREFEIVIPGPHFSTCSLEVEGII